MMVLRIVSAHQTKSKSVYHNHNYVISDLLRNDLQSDRQIAKFKVIEYIGNNRIIGRCHRVGTIII